MQDGALIKSAIGGDESAAWTLLLSWRSRITRHAKLAGLSDPEDFAGDVLIKAYKHLHEVKSPEAFSPWMRKLIRNALDDAWDHQVIRQSVTGESLDDVIREDPQWQNPESVLVDDTAAAIICRDELETALNRLSRKHQTILRLYYWNHMTVADIAIDLAMPRGTIERLLTEARKTLEKDLGQSIDYGSLAAGMSALYASDLD